MMPANVRHHPSDFINKNKIKNKAAISSGNLLPDEIAALRINV